MNDYTERNRQFDRSKQIRKCTVEKLPSYVVEQPIPPDLKAELDARAAESARIAAGLDADRRANPDLFANLTENNTINETNVAYLDESTTNARIDYITFLNQSGEAEKHTFQAGNGDQTTNSIHQFLQWLQERAQNFDSDGTYSPDMFK